MASPSSPGLTREANDGVEREYLLLEYAKGDKLYVPVDQSDRVTRYTGGGIDPQATKLGRANGCGPSNACARPCAKWPSSSSSFTPPEKRPAAARFRPTRPGTTSWPNRFPIPKQPISKRRSTMSPAILRIREANGSSGLRRRRLRQNRSRPPRGVQGGQWRQAGRGAGADDRAGAAAFRNIHAAARGVSGPGRDALSPAHRSKEQGEVVEALAEGAVDIVIGTHRLVQNGMSNSRISVWPSSTRSSGSVSATRNS